MLSKMDWCDVVDHVEKKLKFGAKFKEWMLSRESVGYHFDYLLWGRAYAISRELEKDNDHISVIAGMEGSGKSTMATQLCSVVSPNFQIKNICFELPNFLKQLRDAKAGDSFQLDEGAMFLFSREAMSRDNRITTKLLTVIRQKNLHICVCIPNFFIIDSYVRDHRVKTLLQVKSRGLYKGHIGTAIKLVSKYGAKNKNVFEAKIPNGSYWDGRFNKTFPLNIDMDEYRKYKAKHLDSFLKDITKSYGGEPRFVPLKEVKHLFTKKGSSLYDWLKSGEIKAEKMGGSWVIDRKSLEKYGFFG